MGLFDMLGGLTGRRAPKTGNPLLDALLPMLLTGGAIGSIGGLIGKFINAGLGGKANSWVGTGANDTLEPDEVEQALGSAEVDRIATAAGVERDDARSGLAALIPNLVDRVSPGGSLPTGNLAKALQGFDFGALLAR